MIELIALLIAILLHFVAAITALSLIRRTKYSASWIFISIALLLLAIQRALSLIPLIWHDFERDVSTLDTWASIVSSFALTVGVFLISKIFNFIKKVERSRAASEKRLLQAVVRTEEKERKRFAKDLHDGLGPVLSTIKLSISSLSQLETDAKKHEIIENADKLINEAIRSVKDISNNLSPHILDNFGLASAINNFASKVNLTGSIHIVFHSDLYEQRFDYNTEVVLYRVVCELINNTIRHANAHNIDIELRKVGNMLTINYSDDGIGFDVNMVLTGQRGGMGYSNILNRLRTIKGMINVESDARSGTKAIILVNVHT